MKAITAVVVVAIASAGCSTLKSESIVQRDGKSEKTIGTVTTWSPDKAAAVVLGDKACLQLPTRLVNVGTSGRGAAAVNVAGQGNAGGGGAGDFRSDSTSALVATERTTFLSFGLFYMCQMAMNKSINDATLKDMLTMVVATSATLKPPPVQPPAFVVAEHFTMHAPPPEKPVEVGQEEQANRVTPGTEFSIEE
ncbi:hypothetical protein MNO14_06670 [Luteimonas sp. S4-F44]|uniref:hypothetical protein n=1 Tax=Luteimonas sp. S4-F44 TaxID=2925842 RepID=UPI001F532833|nr:hypothetical protein [Luteimonas sp. S4-F44]UNK43737.1 hypothetical protein MNO14_06670 [Luteimonas sp. S4-F44]